MFSVTPSFVDCLMRDYICIYIYLFSKAPDHVCYIIIYQSHRKAVTSIVYTDFTAFRCNLNWKL